MSQFVSGGLCPFSIDPLLTIIISYPGASLVADPFSGVVLGYVSPPLEGALIQ